ANGFKIGNAEVESPKSIQTATAQISPLLSPFSSLPSFFFPSSLLSSFFSPSSSLPFPPPLSSSPPFLFSPPLSLSSFSPPPP
ncbi:hypothetical protein ACXWRS_11185, partial [Streptococcus pyogenes]